MCRRILALCVVAAHLVVWIARTEAQTPSGAGGSLSDRLEQFRQDLLGEPRPPIKRKDTPNGSSSANNSPSQSRLSAASKAAGTSSSTTTGNNASGNSGATAAPAATTPSSTPAASPQPTLAKDPGASSTPAAAPSSTPAASAPAAETASKPRKQELISQGIRRAQPGSVMGAPMDAKPIDGKSAPSGSVSEHASEGTAVPMRTAKLDRSAPPANAGENADAGKQLPPGDSVLMSGQSPTLSVETVGPKKVRIGQEAVFTVKVHNSGAAPANNIVVSVNIPGYAEIASTKPSAGNSASPRARPAASRRSGKSIAWSRTPRKR